LAKIIDRLLLFIYSLVILVAGCIGLAAVFEWVPVSRSEAVLHAAYVYMPAKYGWIAFFAVLVLISIRFFYISVRTGSGSGAPSIDQRTEVGDIRISMETVENLSLKAATRVRGVKDLKARVRVSNAGLEIVIRTLVDGEYPIPPMTEEIQNQVKNHIEEMTGIPVAEVSVFVANIAPSQITFKSRVE